jgi:hypothetical protein
VPRNLAVGVPGRYVGRYGRYARLESRAIIVGKRKMMADMRNSPASVPTPDPALEVKPLSPSPVAGTHSRWWPRWLTLALPLAALAPLLGFALNAEITFRRRAEAIRVLQKLGDVWFDKAPPRSWVSELFGLRTSHYPPVKRVSLQGRSATPTALSYVGRIAELRRLEFLSGAIADTDLELIRDQNALQSLSLENSTVTDDGLVHLRGLVNLQTLILKGTRVTGTGFAHLRGLTNLELLFLNDTGLTDVGLAHLGGLTRLRRLDISKTSVTDAGLVHVGDLEGLEVLRLENTSVTDAGLANVRGSSYSNRFSAVG